MTRYVQFNADGTVTEYACPQDGSDKPGYAEVANNDARLVAWDAGAAARAKPRPTPRQWLERLSPQTQLAIETAALSNAQVSLWLRKATGASDGIDVTLQETKDGIAAMVAAGLLTMAEQTTLLTP